MVFVELRLSLLDLLGDMADMRIWLDRYRVDSSGFSCLDHPDGMLAHVAFKKQSEAEAFAARFAGRVVSSAGPSPGQPAPPPLIAAEKPAAFPGAIHRIRSGGADPEQAMIAAKHYRAGKRAPLEPLSLRMKAELSLQALKQAVEREIAERRGGSRRPRAG